MCNKFARNSSGSSYRSKEQNADDYNIRSTFTFTFSHLADAFIQSDLQLGVHKASKGVINKIETELLKEVEHQIPTELWSQHDTDIGLITSANPIRVQLKPDARLPRKAQYPLHPDAEVGIKNTIEGLVKAGVLIETTSNINTPILPVIKADKNRWRLVHDLRAINEIVEDLPAEVQTHTRY